LKGWQETLAEQDERLLIEAAQREPRRFGEIYELHFHRVYAYVVKRVGNRAEAEDVTAEVFHQALANLGRFEWRGTPFVAWLYRIAANAVADRRQQAARQQDGPEESAAPDAGVEQRAMLFTLVDALPEDQRRVVYLRFVEQKTIREIAAEMGRTEGAVKQLQFRALTTLRVRMGAKTNG
jgi:RNA polymerase sigma-70 factor (ECF subfamily)